MYVHAARLGGSYRGRADQARPRSHHGIPSFISPPAFDSGGGGGAAPAVAREEGRRMRMQSTVFPPIVVLAGYNSICCPGQSSVSGQPVASQTASKFVAFNGSDLGTFSK